MQTIGVPASGLELSTRWTLYQGRDGRARCVLNPSRHQHLRSLTRDEARVSTRLRRSGSVRSWSLDGVKAGDTESQPCDRPAARHPGVATTFRTDLVTRVACAQISLQSIRVTVLPRSTYNRDQCLSRRRWRSSPRRDRWMMSGLTAGPGVSLGMRIGVPRRRPSSQQPWVC
jgi:hypothetical protein